MIHRLTPDTVGKIAAGEVIERPAAAIKELLENAIDAGATRVDVAIVGGGIELLEVRDDGAGIAFDELSLAVERHATSKITSLEDLKSLSTLGFRGEALASLAAVSELRVTSITRGAPVGGELHVSFGSAGVPRPIPWNLGTAVTARDLFDNVPARRKFLRQAQTESNYVQRVVAAYALAYPAIAFSLESDGRRTLASDGRGDVIGAALAVWGTEVAEQLVQIERADESVEGFRVSGVVSLPTVDRATRQQQFLFAQRRLITSRQLSTAFEQAYQSLLMVGRHPIGCIMVEVPPERVDVNVHPTKAEVRFADERLVFIMVQRSVREAILGSGATHTPMTVMSSPLVDHAVQRRIALAHPVDRGEDPGWSTLGQGIGLEAGGAQLTPHTSTGRALPVLRVLGQIAGMFIVAEGPDGMYLVDQHAAHERILFERLMREFEGRSTDVQLLLNPVIVELPAREWEVFVACHDELQAIGFEVDEFGQSSVLIRGVPAILRVKDVARTLLTILSEIASGGRGQTRLESLAISAACHTSIRAGQTLTLLEMRELITQLELCSSPMACGHGRPTMLRMTAEDLERQFSRH
jgi:DNA mismatch repair protein MutL